MIASLSQLNPNPTLGFLTTDHLVYNLTNYQTLIGRNPEMTIILNHPSISKEHAKIEFELSDDLTSSSSCYITDLNSSAGTYVNSKRLPANQPSKLKENDRIQFGKDTTQYIISFNEKYFKNQSERSKKKFDFPIVDNKISLVNSQNYESAKINHLAQKGIKFNTGEINYNFDDDNNNNNNIDNIKEELNYDDINNNINNANPEFKIIENEEEATMKDSAKYKPNTFAIQSQIHHEQIQQQPSSLYQEIYKQNSSLESKLKEKTSELSNITSLYEQLNDKYNKLNAKHNALMIYASDIQKKNDTLELLIKEQENKLTNINSQDIMKQLKEKEKIITHLQSENEIYKNELSKLKSSLTSSPTNPFKLEENINKLIDEYLKENMKLKQIINKYITYEKGCNQKWNELIISNETLTTENSRLKTEWSNDLTKYQMLLEAADKRLSCALAQVPKNFNGFNIKKEEAAKYLVEQMNACLEEKNKLLKDNTVINKKNVELSLENEKLKDEILQNEIKLKNKDVGELKAKIEELEDMVTKYKEAYNPSKILDYEDMVVRMDLQIKEKDKIIEEYKFKFDNVMKNQNFLNFDDRQVVSSVSEVLKEKDKVIKNLKDKIIDYSSGNDQVNQELEMFMKQQQHKDNNI